MAEETTIKRMENFQFFLFCTMDAIALLINGGILMVLFSRWKSRASVSEKLYISIVLFQFTTGLGGIVLATKFDKGSAGQLRDDTIIVQVTFSLIGLALNEIMITVDRIIALTLPNRYPMVIGRKQIWIMLIITWVIPVLIAIFSTTVITTGKPSRSVSHGLAVLAAASGLTAFLALTVLNAYLFKQIRQYAGCERLRVLTDGDIKGAQLCVGITASYIALWFPQLFYIIGRLVRIRGVRNLWYVQLVNTLVLCNGIVDACLYILLRRDLRRGFRELFRFLQRRSDDEESRDIPLAHV